MRLLLLSLVPAALALAQSNFAGAMGGVSTLSADARVAGSPPERISAYKPENGAAIMVLGGRHFSEYFSAQLSYGWNRNEVNLTGADLSNSSSFEMPVRATLHSYVAEAMAYFRARRSRLRPYLSAGPGVVYAKATRIGAVRASGSPALPSSQFNSTQPALRVAVGVDLRIHDRFNLRYSFSETIQRNPLSRAIRPPGERNLANFQNWWGVVWVF